MSGAISKAQRGSMAVASASVLTEPHAMLRLWLLAVAGLVFAMVIVGGATRLTDSGLSITEWQPLLGAIPPMSEADWQSAFAKYQTIPQAQIVNKGMTLAEFKVIYWWEWAHRFLGRFIGLAFAVPLLVFWLAGRLDTALKWRLTGILCLGALQGFIGWYMVKSGLVDRIDVSPYRLALHLGIAVLIFAALLWTYFDLAPDDGEIRLDTISDAHKALSAAFVVAIFAQIVLGGLVAGLKAGRAFNTWPLMDGRWFPDAALALTPWYLNLTENMAMVQFEHRMLAYIVALGAVIHIIGVARNADDERLVFSSFALLAALAVQIGLGIWTVVAAVPIALGLAHQAGALVVLAAALLHRHRALRLAP